jgi:hypothetical protein
MAIDKPYEYFSPPAIQDSTFIKTARFGWNFPPLSYKIFS